MRHRLVVAVPLLALALAAGGCRGDSTEAAPAAAPPPAESAAAPAAKQEEEDDDAQGKRRMAEPTAYLDGQAIAGLRFLELPQKLKPVWVKTSEDGPPARRYRIAEYIEALGVSLSSVKEVHLVGGRNRHSIITGAELQRVRDDLMFSFGKGHGGKPRMNYPPEVIVDVNTKIDMIQMLLIYQHREPPKYNPKRMYAYFEDGRPIEGIPYAPGERAGGTRVYVDGALIGAIKRKTLPSSVAVPGSDAQGLTRFRLQAYLEQLGVAGSVRGMELVTRDEVVATFDAKTWAEKAAGLLFTLPKRNRGRIQVLEMVEQDSKLDAILVYVKSPLPDRVAERATPGSSSPQVTPISTSGLSQKRSISAKATLAQPLQ